MTHLLRNMRLTKLALLSVVIALAIFAVGRADAADPPITLNFGTISTTLAGPYVEQGMKITSDKAFIQLTDLSQIFLNSGAGLTNDNTSTDLVFERVDGGTFTIKQVIGMIAGGSISTPLTTDTGATFNLVQGTAFGRRSSSMSKTYPLHLNAPARSHGKILKCYNTRKTWS